MDPITWLLVGIALSAVSYVIMPKPKQQSNVQAPQQMDTPKANAGTPWPILFGEATGKSPFILYFGDKDTGEYEVKA